MVTRRSASARNAGADAIADLLDAGAGAATIQIRTGAQPATPDTAATGTLLATFTMTDPAFGAAAAGVATADTTPPLATTGVAAGDAGWARFLDSNGAAVLDGSVTATGGGGDVQLNTVAVPIGLDLELTAITYTEPL